MNVRFVVFVGVYLALHVAVDAVLVALLPWVAAVDRVRRGALYRVFWAYNALVSGLFFGSRVTGADVGALRGPCVFCVNHETNWDHLFVWLLGPRHPRTLMKRAVLLMGPVGLTQLLLGQVWVYRGPGDAVRRANRRSLDRCVFPEGHRRWMQEDQSEPLGPFKLGAFQVACEAGVPVVPIVISDAHLFDDRRLEVHPGTFRAHVLDPVSSAGRTPEQLMQLVRSQMIAALPLVKDSPKSQ
eukprot:m51a1_g14152 putative 1-acyl-sn-glycerol-3-phosphate acyltransferase alpha-like (241) ;mRNA; r:39911-40820